MKEAATRGARGTARSLRIYAAYVISLVRPGVGLPTYEKPEEPEAPLDGWGTDDFTLMIEEGRRQLDGQFNDLEKIRGRAQWLFSAALILGGSEAAAAARVFHHPIIPALAAWAIAAASTIWAALGAAGIITVRADFSSIATIPLSNYTPPIRELLARNYAEMLDQGEQTVNTRLTLYRQAVVWLLIGALAALAAYLFAVTASHPMISHYL